MKPLALLLGILLLAAAGFVLVFDDGGTEPDPSGVETASSVDKKTDNRRKPRNGAEAPPLAVIPPADAVPQEPVDAVALERGTPETGFVGQVLTPSGSGLADAIVTLWRLEGASALDPSPVRVAEPVHTDNDGSYEILGLKGGDAYLLSAEHGAFAAVSARDLEVEADQVRRVPDIRLQNGVVVVGSVTGPDREPVIGAVVEATDLTSRKRKVVRQVLTDENGGYRLAAMTAGAYEVSVSAEGLETARSPALTLLRDRAEARHDFLLTKGQVLAGFVKTADGRPIPGARVSVIRMRGTGASFGSASSDAKGHFEITGLSAGSYNITATRNGFIEQTKPFVPSDRRNVQFAMMPTVGVTGFVKGPDKKPVSAFFIRAWKVTEQGRLSDAIGDPIKVRSKDGSYTLENLTPGHYKVEAFAPGLAPSLSKRFRLQRLYVHGIVVRMKKGASISGAVVDSSGIPVKGATVRLLSNAFRPGPLASMLYDKSNRLGRQKSDDAGRFLFDGLAGGQYQLEIKQTDRQTVYHRDIQVTGEALVEVGPFTLLEGGHLKGTVVDTRNVAANGARVTLATDADGIVQEARADDRGEFSLRNLPAGSYRISATVSNSTTGTADDIFAQAIKSLSGAVDVAVIEGQTTPITLYVN